MKETHTLIQDIFKAFETLGGKAVNYKQICKTLNITSVDSKKKVEKLLADLSFKGELIEVAPGKYKRKDQQIYIIGTLDVTKSGIGYVVSEASEKDIFIPRKYLDFAFHGDVVKVAVSKNSLSKEKPEGKIVEVLERARTEWVGVLQVSKNHAFLIPDNTKFTTDVYIPLSKLNGAKDKEKVIVRIFQWPDDVNNSPTGEVIEILGTPGDTSTEVQGVLAEFGLPRGFPSALEDEAKKIPIEISSQEIKNRRDFRGITTFTIDPFDAKDFDDAISYQVLDNGNVEVGVHIADVTHYVQPGSEIDKEAQNRATSIYLVDRVIPMLPEILSNQVCSLRPNEDKLCFSAVFTLNSKAEIVHEWFGRTVIHSIRRFTYEEVQQILEDGAGEMHEILHPINQLAKILRKNRMSKGAIAFEKEEVKFKLDEKGQPLEVFFKTQKDAHKLIEEFMLLANRRVSEFVGKPKHGEKHKNFIYRVHDTPNPDKLNDFVQFVKTFGYSFNANHHKDVSQSFNKLLQDVKGKKEAHLIETLAVRTMAKAVYSTNNIGHYGLAFDYYSHFTSPIRRYPDMIAHRLLQHYLHHGNSVEVSVYENLCKHCSVQERLAEEAERASIKFMQVLYMQNRVGEIFNGVVSGVTEWGIFVEIGESKTEGLIRLRDIPGDYYEFEQKKHRVVGKRTKKTIQLADVIKVKVKGIDILKKQIELEVLSN